MTASIMVSPWYMVSPCSSLAYSFCVPAQKLSPCVICTTWRLQLEFFKMPRFTKPFWISELSNSIFKYDQDGSYLFMQGNFHWWVKGIKIVLIGCIILKYLECTWRLRLLIKINCENSHTDYNFHVDFKCKKIILKEKYMLINSSKNLIPL